jgi:hypothetical protein
MKSKCFLYDRGTCFNLRLEHKPSMSVAKQFLFTHFCNDVSEVKVTQIQY